MKKIILAVLLSVAFIGAADAATKVVAWNDLGMHCIDPDFSVFSILPPYNTLRAQVQDTTTNKLITTGVTLTYESVADSTGSINTTNAGKTNFWDYSGQLFGATPAMDVGLTGAKAPSLVPEAFDFNATESVFEKVGIPVTPYDDKKMYNPYPLVRVKVKNATGAVIAQSDVVLPVADEMHCSTCHTSNNRTKAVDQAAKPKTGWIWDTNTQKDYRLNILKIHDDKFANYDLFKAAVKTLPGYKPTLYATATSGKSILCWSCHGTNAVALPGYPGIRPLTEAMHRTHGDVRDPVSNVTLSNMTIRNACYLCHPGEKTQCLRGAMGDAKDKFGNHTMRCQSCHGNMKAVGIIGRTGWLDEPNCQSCHHDGKRETVAHTDLNTGKMKVWTDVTFATNANVPVSGKSLYRFSTGHGKLQCEACHNSTHAEFPTATVNDNVRAVQHQGYAGVIRECSSCHDRTPTAPAGVSTFLNGPHGLHVIGQSAVSTHKDYAKSHRTECQYCHGTTYRGTALSAVKVAKTLTGANGKVVSYTAGQPVTCYDCHNGPNP